MASGKSNKKPKDMSYAEIKAAWGQLDPKATDFLLSPEKGAPPAAPAPDYVPKGGIHKSPRRPQQSPYKGEKKGKIRNKNAVELEKHIDM